MSWSGSSARLASGPEATRRGGSPTWCSVVGRPASGELVGLARRTGVCRDRLYQAWRSTREPGAAAAIMDFAIDRLGGVAPPPAGAGLFEASLDIERGAGG
ncbi:MAG: hypothetical protein F4X40_03130 [Chloroflexi bacterium]|nr:hypothetical protein [Chloroflexota bacterium]